LAHGVVHGVATQHDGEIGPGALERPREPEHGVVLLFQRAAIRGLDEIENAHDVLPYLVGMTRVVVDATAISRKFAGPPRLTPSIQLPAPRSSTQSPQFTQLSRGCDRPISSSAATRSFVVGCSSCSTEVPLTGLACGACSFTVRLTAPSYAKTLTSMPFARAAAMMRKAVVEAAAS